MAFRVNDPEKAVGVLVQNQARPLSQDDLSSLFSD